MGPGMLVKHFIFVPNKTLNIKQAFVVFTKEKGIVECVLENTASKYKIKGIIPCQHIMP